MMNKNINELIKNALEEHELPYDSSAWSALEKKLNNPIAPNKPFKFWFLGIGLVAIVGVIYFLYKTEDSTKEKQRNEILILEETEGKTSENGDLNIENIEKGSSKDKSIDEENKHDFSKNGNETILSLKKENKWDSKAATEHKTNSSCESNKNDNFTISKKEVTEVSRISYPSETSIPSFSDKCLDESVKVTNKNEALILLYFPSGKEVTIKSNSTETIKLIETGKYKLNLQSKNSPTVYQSSSFFVYDKPQVNLDIEDNLNYESGLPIIKGEVQTTEESISWKVNNTPQFTSSDKSKIADFCFFQKGKFELTVTIVNVKGCSNSESKTITINEEYNLLAVNAFDPLSTDSRKNSFMPYALSIRTTAFNLLIIDPSTGEIVFQSTDATKVWDGIDKRDGKLVNENKAFIWKVTLAAPEKNEKSVYKGTIIRI